jgi:enoyl-CoA hydratase/carnithine racemase
MILTGGFISSDFAKAHGICADVLGQDELLPHAISQAQKIASFSQPIVAMAKDCVNQAYESHLHQGNMYEKKVFWSTFATKDRLEGMTAFSEKRKAEWKDE